MSPEEIENRILAGEHLVIYNGHALRISQNWLNNHPGGALAILHFVGRDASDELNAYHSDATLRRMSHYIVSPVELPWKPLLPPVMAGWVRKSDQDGRLVWAKEADALLPDTTSQILLVKPHAPPLAPIKEDITPPPSTLSPEQQQQHIVAYRALHERIKQAGLYETRYLAGYGPEIARYTLFIAISSLAYFKTYYMTSALFLGFLWHQLTFTAHDLGHCGVTHSWFWDRLIGILVADLMGGISIGWWVDVSIHAFLFKWSNVHLESQYTSS